MVIFYLLFFAAFGWVMYSYVIYPIKEAVKKGALSDYGEFKDGVLNLEKRGAGLQKCIKIEPHRITNYSHKDEEYIFTSATVGGVTTGGIHKNEAYDYASSSRKTGRYEMTISYRPIQKIELTSDLFDLAKSSYISEYLDEESHSIVVVTAGRMSADTLAAWQSGERGGNLLNLTQRDMEHCYPSYEKCQKILNWLSVVQ